MVNQYTYVKKDGSEGIIDAETPELALSSAPDIAPTSGVQFYRAPANKNTAPTPSTASTGAPASGDTYGILDQYGKKKTSTKYSRQRDKLSEILFKAPIAPDEENIREIERTRAQSVTDNITREYAPDIERAKQMGLAREKRTRALSTNAGLGGSDFAAAAALGAIDETNKDIGFIEQERDAKISAILADADYRATEKYKAARTEYLAEVEGKYDKINEFIKAQSEAARSNAMQLAASGVSLAALKQQAPEIYEQLLEETGYDEAIFNAVYNAGLPANQKREYTYQKIGNAMYAISTDPITGKPVSERITAPGEMYDDFMITPDGTPIFLNTAEGTYKVAGAEGQFSKNTGGNDDDEQEDSPTGLASQFLQMTAGSDGYVSPVDFKEARKAWVADSKNGTMDDFNKRFLDYVNPAHSRDYGVTIQ